MASVGNISIGFNVNLGGLTSGMNAAAASVQGVASAITNSAAVAVGGALNTELTRTEAIIASVNNQAAVGASIFTGMANALKAGLGPIAAMEAGFVRALGVAGKLALAVAKHQALIYGLGKAADFAKARQMNMLAGVLDLTQKVYKHAWKIELAWWSIKKAATACILPFKIVSATIQTGVKAVKSLALMAAVASGAASLLLLPIVAAGGSITATIAGLIASARAASDLAEASNLVNVTFGEGAPIVQAAADDMAARFGIVKTEFLSGAGAFQTILDTIGKGPEATAEMSVAMAKLATDISSFRNISVSDALQKLQSGLTGEVEPLRTLGIFLSETAVKQEAYRQGIAKTGAELTEAQKIAARYSLIMGQSSDAQGDLERTADGAANAARGIGGRIQNLAADIGTAFSTITGVILGATSKAVVGLATKIGDLGAKFKEWADASVQTGGIINTAVGYVGEGIATVVDAIHAGRIAFNVLAAVGLTALASLADGVAGLLGPLDQLAKALGKDLGIEGAIGDQADKMRGMSVGFARSAAELAKAGSGGDAVRGFFEGFQKDMDELAKRLNQAPAAGKKKEGGGGQQEAKLEEVKVGGALEFGSAEARSAIISASVNKPDGVAERQLEQANKQTITQGQLLTEMRNMVRAFSNQPAANI